VCNNWTIKLHHGVRQTSAAVEMKYKNCRECTTGHLPRNVNDICSITPVKLNDNSHLVWSSTASPSKQRLHRWVDTDNGDQQVYNILSTVIHLTSFERWTEFWKLNWVRAYKRSSTSIVTYLTNNCRLIDVTSLKRRRHQLYLYYSLFFILYLFIIRSNLSLLSHLGHHTALIYRLGDRSKLPYMQRCHI